MSTLLPLAYLVYVVAISLWVVLERRHPLATVAWLLALALLPGVGVPVFFLLGPRRLRRQRLRRRRAAARLHEQRPHHEPSPRPPPAPSAGPIARLAWRAGETPLTTGNEARLLGDAAQFYEALEEAIATARHHVHLTFYIVQADATGRRLLDRLTERARAGVEVRLLVDAFGSSSLKERHLRALRDAGGHVARFNPLRWQRLWPINFRNHRKLVVVDGRVGFAGGINIGDEYLGLGTLGAWHDEQLALRGPAVHNLQELFVEDWHFATGEPLTSEAYFPPAETIDPATPGQQLLVLGSGPDREWPAIAQVYASAIFQAQHHVRLATPYFVPDDVLLAALCCAALRGVTVEVLLPARSDAPIVAAAGRSYFDVLLRAGVRVCEFRPGFLHAKALSVDGRFCAVGSANFDPRSFRLNFEVTVLGFDGALPAQVDARLAADLSHAAPVTVQGRRRLGRLRRLGEALARVLSPLL